MKPFHNNTMHNSNIMIKRTMTTRRSMRISSSFFRLSSLSLSSKQQCLDNYILSSSSYTTNRHHHHRPYGSSNTSTNNNNNNIMIEQQQKSIDRIYSSTLSTSSLSNEYYFSNVSMKYNKKYNNNRNYTSLIIGEEYLKKTTKDIEIDTLLSLSSSSMIMARSVFHNMQHLRNNQMNNNNSTITRSFSVLSSSTTDRKYYRHNTPTTSNNIAPFSTTGGSNSTNDDKHEIQRNNANNDTTTINETVSVIKEDDDNDNNNNNDIYYYFTNRPLSALYQGFGQVIFVNSDIGGAIILSSLFIGCNGNLYLPSLALLGTGISQLIGYYSTINTVTEDNHYSNGLISYNGCLIGCASAVFIPTIPTAIGTTIIGSATTTYLSIVLSKLFSTGAGMPQWTYAFNIIMLGSLLRIQPFNSSSSTPSIIDDGTTTITTATATDPISLSDTIVSTSAEVGTTTIATSSSLFDIIIQTPFTGISQIYLVESSLCGIMIIGAIARTYSPTLASYAILGSIVGSITGNVLCNAPTSDIISGLYGYNSALTAMGIGVFFQSTSYIPLFIIVSSSATAIVHDTMSYILNTTFHTPCLTLPFCITMSTVYILGLSNTIPGISISSNPHSPEKNRTESNKK